METTTDTEETVTQVPAVHRLGKFFVGGFAAFAADQLAMVAYDKVLAAVRARKAR